MNDILEKFPAPKIDNWERRDGCDGIFVGQSKIQKMDYFVTICIIFQ